ncbi:MAG: bacteriocin immunity protein, partial [Streptococcus salivarius]|nr:bacteriocin immunity protein [Streptococcus salivarius]
MTGLKWFAAGKERREQAVAIIDEVIETIGDKPDYADLKQVLHSYRTELADSRSATPYILSRMSLEISEVVRKDQLTLSP